MLSNPVITSDCLTTKTSFFRDERGLSTVEYVIILILIAAAAVGSWNLFGGMMKSKLGNAEVELRNMTGSPDSASSGAAFNGAPAAPQPAVQGPASPAARASGKVTD